MNKIYAVALNLHDHNTYDGVYHNQRERHTRFKHNLPYKAEAYAHQSDILNVSDYRLNDEFTENYFKKPDDAILAFTYTFGGVRKSKQELLNTILKGHDKIFDYDEANAVYSIFHNNLDKNDFEKIIFDSKLQNQLIKNGEQYIDTFLANPGTASENFAKIINENYS